MSRRITDEGREHHNVVALLHTVIASPDLTFLLGFVIFIF